jgi:Predicted nucleic acid-binding protein, contains PIN domain
MIIVDANILLYAYDELSPAHAKARWWLEATFNGEEQVGLGLQTVLAFLRIATNRVVYEHPLTSADALSIVASWLEHPHVRMATPGERHWQILSDVAREGQARGPHLMDAHLAALAIEHGASLATTDRGFGRFSGLRFNNPIAT